MSEAFAGMAEICEQIKAKYRAKALAELARNPPRPLPPPKTREQLQADLNEALSGFDPAYPFSDDYTEFCRQQAKDAAITRLRRALAALDAQQQEGRNAA